MSLTVEDEAFATRLGQEIVREAKNRPFRIQMERINRRIYLMHLLNPPDPITDKEIAEMRLFRIRQHVKAWPA